MKAKKILLLPVGIGLAHVGRCIVLAKELKRRGHDVIIASGPEAKNLVHGEGLVHREILDFTRDDVQEIQRLNPFFLTVERIKLFVEEELTLFHQEKPDLVISDFRVTAKISAAVYGVPYVFITNTDTTKFYDYSRARLTIPAYLTRHLPERTLRVFESQLGQKLTKQAFSALTRVAPLPILFHFNQVCSAYRLPRLLSIFDVPMGDITLLVDIAEFRPTKKLPFSVFQVGPLVWECKRQLPSWENSFYPPSPRWTGLRRDFPATAGSRICGDAPDEARGEDTSSVLRQAQDGERSRTISSRELHSHGKPVIYITASGTGDPAIFRLLLSFLEGGPWVVVGTVGNVLKVQDVSDFVPPQFFITDFLPGKWIFPKSDLLIFPGGNSTAYQTLSFGVPQVVVPINFDQEDNANQLVRLGTALKLDAHRLTREKFLKTINLVLTNESFRNKSRQFSKTLQNYNGPHRAANIIEGYLVMHEK